MRTDKLAHHSHLIGSIVSTLHSSWAELPPWSEKNTISIRLEVGVSGEMFLYQVVAFWRPLDSIKFHLTSVH